jgi:DNA invertase Pin-like site-specific DNA recombinase
VSEDRTGEGAAVDRQRDDAKRLLELRGDHLVAEYVDNDTSAAGRKPRPGFVALLDAVQAGEIDTVVAWTWDRLTRNRRDSLRLIEIGQKHNLVVGLIRGSDIDMSTPAGRLVADMLAGVARHEIDQKSDRQRRAYRQAAEAGRMGGGPRAFGYQRGGLEIHPEEGPLLRGAYERWLAGSGLEELADWLNHAGMTTPKGNKWRGNTLRIVLGNPRNAGLRAMRPIVDESTGRRATWHDSPIAKAIWPGVVSEEVYAAAMARLKDPARHGNALRSKSLPKGPTAKYLLSGIASCGQCGEPMITGQGGDGVRRLNCRSKRHVNRRADYVEAYVILRLLKRLSEPDAHELLLPTVDDGPDLEEVRLEQLAKREQQRKLGSDWVNGLSDEAFRAADEKVKARLAELDVIIANAGRTDVVAPLVTAEDPAMAWETYPLSTQRLVIQRLMEITIYRASPGRPKGGVYDTSTIGITWRDQA